MQFVSPLQNNTTLSVCVVDRMGYRAHAVNAWDFLRGIRSTDFAAAAVMAKRWDVCFIRASPLLATTPPHVVVVKVRIEKRISVLLK